MLSKEEIEKDNAFKISVPLITDEEIRNIDNNFEDIVNEFTKSYVKEKELVIAQHIIKKQKVELESRNTVSKKQYNHLKKSLKGEINKLNKELKESQKETMQIYSDYQDIGKIAFDLDEKVQKLIKKLEDDIINDYHINKPYGDKYCTYGVESISTKEYAKEILSILKGEKE